MRHTFHAPKRFKTLFRSHDYMLAGRQYPSLRCGGARSALSCLSSVLSWEVFFSAVVLRFLVPAFHVFLCCSEDGLALFWRLGALRVAVLTRSRLLVFRILFRGGFLLGAFSAGPAPPFVQLWARVEVRSGSVAKLSLGTVAPFSSIRFPFRETVAGLFGCAVERSSEKSHVAELLVISGACGRIF